MDEQQALLETRRKRLLYRSVYRGNKENDILLGQFARAHIESFGPAELDQYERLLAVGDNDITQISLNVTWQERGQPRQLTLSTMFNTNTTATSTSTTTGGSTTP